MRSNNEPIVSVDFVVTSPRSQRTGGIRIRPGGAPRPCACTSCLRGKRKRGGGRVQQEEEEEDESSRRRTSPAAGGGGGRVQQEEEDESSSRRRRRRTSPAGGGGGGRVQQEVKAAAGQTERQDVWRKPGPDSAVRLQSVCLSVLLCATMSTAKKRSSFQITSVTSDSSQTPPGQSASSTILNLLQSEASSSGRHGSSSQPSTPCLNKKTAHDAPGQGTGSSSRFRVVRLAVGGASSKGRGESYHRGRWTSTDFMERPEGAGIRRVMESTRHAHSLESLEMIGRDNERGWVHSQDTSHLLAQPIRDPPSPTHPENSLLVDQRQPKEKQTLDSAFPRPLARPNRKPPPLRLDFDADGRSVLRLSHSQPSSPPVGLHQPPPANVQTLDQSIFNPGNDSFSTNSLIAIDNKIEQAMDLVKSHLLLAVREEVELLREQIRDLQQKNQQLERENHVLRALNTTHCDEP